MDMTSNIHDESILRELSKSHSSSRKDLLFEHVITDSKDRSCINAYKIKRDIEKVTVKSPTHIRIVSTQPLALLPEGKFNHCQGARISPITLTRSQHKLLDTEAKSPKSCKAGAVHQKLSSIESFPLAYKQKLHLDNNANVVTDLVDDSTKVINILSGTSKTQLNIPGRSADFKNEVNWRMQLRN